MKAFILIMSMWLLCFTFLAGVSVSEELALEIGQKWINHVFPERASVAFSQTQTAEKEGQTLFYILSIEGGGFILVAADDAALPILGFSDTGFFEYPISSPEVGYLIGIYEDQITDAISRRLSNSLTRPAWDEIRAEVFTRWSDTRAVSPLLQTTWNQDTYYNRSCPVDGSGPGGHAYTGCTATAMGQVMKYWNHPAQGTGSNSYTDGTAFPPGYGQISANFGSTSYSWLSMPNSLTTFNTAVETLLFHCGVAVDMDYGVSSGSGALVFTNNAMKVFFAYDPAAQYQSRSSFSDLAWKALMKGNLDQSPGRPIIYQGYDSSNLSGHSFVMDGYNGDYFHFNFGWGGSSDGNFLLDSITFGAPYDFRYHQWAYYDIFPGVTVSGTIKDASNNPLSNVSVSFDSGGGSTTTNAVGFYSLALPKGYTGTATPYLSGYTFTPASKTYNNITSNQTNQNYSGSQSVPADPSNLTATGTAYDQVQLYWTDNSNNEVGFAIESRLGADLTWYPRGTVNPNITSYLDTGLMPQQTYIYRVRAFSGAGYSNPNISSPVTTMLPPPPVGLSAPIVNFTDASVDWAEAGSAMIWDIEYGLTGFSQGSGVYLPMIPSHPFPLPNLQQGTSYDWYVRSFYPSVNVSSPWAGPGNFTTQGTPNLPYPWSENFEAGFVNMLNDPANNTLWSLDNTLFSGGAQSAWNAYQGNNTNILVTTHSFPLTTANFPLLYFDHIAKTEKNYDHSYVEVSIDNGMAWTILAQHEYLGLGNYTLPTLNNPEGPYFMDSSYPEWALATPDNSWWKSEIFDLRAYVGQPNVMLRFRLKSDPSVQRYGWLVDNVMVQESPLYDFSVNAPSDDYVLAGQSVDYTVSIKNKGAQADTYSPSISGGTGAWTYVLYEQDGVTLLPASLLIPPWTSYTYLIRVTAPGSGVNNLTLDNESFSVMSATTGTSLSFSLSTTYLLGDTVSQPLVINSLPFSDSHFTTHYNHNYGPYGDASGLVNLLNPIVNYYSGTSTMGNSNDVVYQLILSQPTLLSIDLLGSSYDTAVVLVTAPGNNPGDVILLNDDYHVRVSYMDSGCNYVPAGTYYIVVGGYLSSSGNYTLFVDAATPPAQPTVTIQLDTANDQVILSWTQNPVMRYNIYSDTDPYGSYSSIVAINVNAGAYTIDGIPSTNTYYRVTEKYCFSYPSKVGKVAETTEKKE